MTHDWMQWKDTLSVLGYTYINNNMILMINWEWVLIIELESSAASCKGKTEELHWTKRKQRGCYKWLQIGRLCDGGHYWDKFWNSNNCTLHELITSLQFYCFWYLYWGYIEWNLCRDCTVNYSNIKDTM